MMRKSKYVLSCLMTIAVLFSIASTGLAANYNTNYSLTGNGAHDIVEVAKAQKGLGGKSGGSAFGFPATNAWCAYFVCWAGRTAGADFPSSNLGTPDAVVKWFVDNDKGTFYCFRDGNYKNLISKGVKNKNNIICTTRDKFTPQKGDLICYLWSNDVGKWNWSHIGIVIDSKKNSISTVEGNSGATNAYNGTVTIKNNVPYNSEVIGFIRPNYNNSSASKNPDDNVTLTLAQTSIELKPGEQATLNFSFTGNIGSPQVQRDDSGIYTDLTGTWNPDKRSGSVTFKASAAGTGSITISLLDENRKPLISKTASITVKVPETTPAKKATTLTFTPSSLSLDLTNQKSQEATLTLGGDFSWGDQLHRSMSNPDVASVDWSSYESGAVFRPVITAKAAGETTLTCSVVDKNSGTTLATAQLKITVTAPNYTIKYDANGGTNAPASQTKAAGQTLTLTSDCPKREGYTFAGWAITASGSAQYQPGDPYTTDQDITLYAVWTADNQVSLSLEKDSFTIKPGEQATINFTFTGDINSVDCEVKNTSICKYDDSEWNQGQHKGSLIVKALSPGTTDITIKLCDEKGGTLTYQTATITVEQVQSIATIELSTSSMNFSCPGETQEIRATTTPGGQNITWSKKIIETLPIPDRNPSAFTMRETSGETNRIRATEAGIAEIIASMTYAGNTYTASCVVTTPGIYVSALDTAVVKEGDRKIMNIGTTEQFSVYTIPSNQTVRWTSSDTSVATVSSNGTVTAVGSGFAEIRATIDVNGNVYSDSCFVLVPEPESNSTLVYVDTLSPFATDRYTGNEGDSFIDVIGRRNGNVDVYGNSYEHGLTAWVARWNYTAESSWVWNQYRLNGNYTSLTGRVVLIKSYNETNFDTQLTISGDGRALYTARLTPDSLPTEEFRINVAGVTTLKIELSDNTSTKGGTAFGLANLALQ